MINRLSKCVGGLGLLFPFLVMAQEPQQYELNGYVKNLSALKNNKAVLMRMVPGRMVFDTAAVVDGRFTFKGVSSTTQKAYLYVTHDGRMPGNIAMGDRIGVYLETGTITVTAIDSLKNAVVGGTVLNRDQQEFVDLLLPVEKQVQLLERNYAAANSSGDSLESAVTRLKYEALLVSRDSILLAFVSRHRQSLVSLVLLRSYFDPATKKAKASAGFDMLDPALQASSQGLIFARMLQRAKALDVGAPAPEFTAQSSTGENIALKSFRGKYVLVDFWASWCVPCRRENPNVVKAFQRFKDKNFTVLGFSLDDGTDGKSKWLDAIQKDGLPWTQLSDLGGWNSPVAMMYNLKAIPANFLLDPAGKIIATNLRGVDLDKKLEEVLGKS